MYGGEIELQELVATGALDRATDLAIRTYGDELIAWLRSILPLDDAYDAFSWLCVELWRSLRRFDGRCTVRTWCYVLARHAVARIRRSRARSREILVPRLPAHAEAVTQIWAVAFGPERREDDVYVEIRHKLDPDDQALLAMRVDQNLAWTDIAQVVLGEAAADQAAVRRKSAALRKQFERVKGQLRELAARRLRD